MALKDLARKRGLLEESAKIRAKAKTSSGMIKIVKQSRIMSAKQADKLSAIRSPSLRDSFNKAVEVLAMREVKKKEKKKPTTKRRRK